MIDKAAITSHSMAIYNHSSIKIKAVMMGVICISGLHPVLEFLFTHDFPNIFQDERSPFDFHCCSDSPALIRGHEPLKACAVLMSLNGLITTGISNWACLCRAFNQHHFVYAVITTTSFFRISRPLAITCLQFIVIMWLDIIIYIRFDLLVVPRGYNVSSW